MRRTLSVAVAALAVLLVCRATVVGQATGTGNGSKTGDGTTPFTGLAQAPEANLFLGSATTSIPFQLPSGRGSMTPQLSLNYSSDGGPSPYGYGWDLSLPRLQRTTKHGVLSCNDTSLRNELVLTLPGTTVECTLSSGSCKPHVEAGFIRIQEVPGTEQREFKVTDKSGITYSFGGSGAVTSSWNTTFSGNGENAATGSTITKGFDPSTPCKYISSWMLRRVEDPNGNYIEYNYIRNGGILYPHSITYGKPAQKFYQVLFHWQTRGDSPVDAPGGPGDVVDPVFNALGGYPATISYRLKSIDILYFIGLVRGYSFTYETGRDGRQTFLQSVVLSGSSGHVLTRADMVTPAATTFIYHQNDIAGFEAAAQTPTRPALSEPPRGLRVRETTGMRRDVLDMNGDGFPDLVDAAIGIQCKSDSTHPNDRFWTVYFGSRDGFSTEATRWYLPPVSNAPSCIIQGVVNGAPGGDGGHARFTTADITGDGIPDYIDGELTTAGGFKQWTVYPGTSVSAYGPGWGFAAPPATRWRFAAGEGRTYVRRTGLAVDVSDLFGYTGQISNVYHDLLDINGDGLLDLVRSCRIDECGEGDLTTNWEVYLNKGDGTGFLAKENFTGQFRGLTVTVGPPATLYTVADMNGDGLPDQVVGHWESGPQAYEVCLNTGHAMDACESWPAPARDPDRGSLIRESTSAPENVVRDLIDMNGDGLPDIVDRNGWDTNGTWRVFLNNGSGFAPLARELRWPAPLGRMRLGGDQGVIQWDTFDVDADGMVDFLDFVDDGASSLYRFFRSTNGAWADPVPGVRPDLLASSENGIGSKTFLRYRPSNQWDNNGSADDDDPVDLPFNLWTVTEICREDGTGFASCVDSSPEAGHLTGMTITYKNGRYDPVERELRGFGQVTTTALGAGNSPPPGNFTEYHQTSALSGKVDRAVTFDASGTNTQTSHPIARTENVWECFNLNTGTVYSSPPYEAGCPPNPGVPGGPLAGEVWVRLKKVEESTYSTAITFKTMETVNVDWEKCGSPPNDQYYGNVSHAYQGASTGAPQLHTFTEYACSASASAYIVDRPKHVTVKNSDQSAVLAEKWLHYDGAYGTVSQGNVTKIEAWLDVGDLGLADTCSQRGTSKCAISTLAYDGRGLLTQVTDPNHHSTTTSYDAENYIYPSTVTRPLGHKTAKQYDPKCGTLLSETIEYVGNTEPAVHERWRNTYDEYCRLQTVYRPGEDTAIYTVPYRRYIYKLGAPKSDTFAFRPTATIVQTREPANAAGYTTSSSLGDALGRVIQQKTQSLVQGDIDTDTPAMKVLVTTNAYNSFGGLEQQFLPEAFPSGTSFELYTQPMTDASTKMLYDAAGRLTKVTHPDAKFRLIEVAEAWQTTTKDECYNDGACTGLKTVEKRDALGRTVERTETDESNVVMSATKHEYDELDRIKATTQGDGTSWNANTTVTTTYDSLGRPVQMVDPDCGSSFGPGTWVYGYDPVGNMRFQNDPRSNQHIQFCYDERDRITKKKYFRSPFGGLEACTANAIQQITYSYDGAVYGLGRPWTVQDLSGQTTITSYNALGQVGQRLRTMDEVNAYTTFGYDFAGRVQSMVYPDGEWVGFLYDPVGRINFVANVSGSPIYVNGLTYDVFGRPRILKHGGTVDTRSYEALASKNYRLRQIKAATGGSVHFLYDYPQYDASGRLTRLEDSRPDTDSLNADATYTYDAIGRLRTANGTAQGLGSHGYCYDVWGNIGCKDSTTTTCASCNGTSITYSTLKPHTAISATGVLPATFQHDANGNRSRNTVSGGPYDYYYDLDDRLRLIDDGGEGAEFQYDDSGRRTKEIRGTVMYPTGEDYYVDEEGADVTYHFTDFLEVTHYPNNSAPNDFKLRKYYFAGDLLIASRETTTMPSGLQVASVGHQGTVRIASLWAGGVPAVILHLQPEAAHGLALALAAAGGVLLCLPRRRMRAVVGVNVRPVDAAVLVVALTVGTLPWPLLIRPTYAQKGPGPTPTRVPDTQVHHYHLDHLGSPQVITDGAGGFVKHIRYKPYGEVRTYGGGAFSDQDDREFTGYEKDPLTGHYYAGARFYDPDFALFLTRDPARQYVSPYTYTNWNPIGRTDPNGTQDLTVLGQVLSAYGGGADAVSAASSGATPGDGGTTPIGSASSDPEPSVAKRAIEGPPPRASSSTLAQAAGADTNARASDGSQTMSDQGGNRVADLHIRSFAPYDSFSGGFKGDNRTFSTDLEATSRIAGKVTFDVDTGKVLNASAASDPTSCAGPPCSLVFGDEAIRAQPNISVTGTETNLSISLSASNPLFRGHGPDIDLSLSLTTNPNGTQTGTLTGDAFPNAEVFVVRQQTAIMQHTFVSPASGYTGPSLYLPGSNTRPMGTFPMRGLR